MKMCENIFYFLKLHGFCFLIIVSLIIFIFCKSKKKDSEEKCKSKPICDFIESYCIYISTLIISILILFIFLYYNSNILKLIPDNKIGESLGLIMSALITVTGVFVGFYFNKKQTYKEIVTRERIEWLHKMQKALAEFLAITSNPKVTNRFKDKKDRARELYYLIISNLNVKEDKEKKKKNENKNERDAVELLYNYANLKGLNVELNFVKDEDSEENKDSNDTKSIDELRKEIISKYTEIFNKTWNRIKNEAD